MGNEVGPIHSIDLFLALLATTNALLEGLFVPQSGDGIRTTGVLFSEFLQGVNQTLQATGVSVVTPAQPDRPTNWLSAAFKTLTIDVLLPGKIYTIISAVQLANIQIAIRDQSEAYNVDASSTQADATYANPYASSLLSLSQTLNHLCLVSRSGSKRSRRQSTPPCTFEVLRPVARIADPFRPQQLPWDRHRSAEPASRAVDHRRGIVRQPGPPPHRFQERDAGVAQQSFFRRLLRSGHRHRPSDIHPQRWGECHRQDVDRQHPHLRDSLQRQLVLAGHQQLRPRRHDRQSTDRHRLRRRRTQLVRRRLWQRCTPCRLALVVRCADLVAHSSSGSP